MSHWTHRGGLLGSFKKMGINVLMAGDPRCFQKTPRAITITRTLGWNSNPHPGKSIWLGLTRSTRQSKESDT